MNEWSPKRKESDRLPVHSFVLVTQPEELLPSPYNSLLSKIQKDVPVELCCIPVHNNQGGFVTVLMSAVEVNIKKT